MALEKGKLQIAEDAFRQALEQYPESHRALTGLADVTPGRKAGSGWILIYIISGTDDRFVSSVAQP